MNIIKIDLVIFILNAHLFFASFLSRVLLRTGCLLLISVAALLALIVIIDGIDISDERMMGGISISQYASRRRVLPIHPSGSIQFYLFSELMPLSCDLILGSMFAVCLLPRWRPGARFLPGCRGPGRPTLAGELGFKLL